MEFINPKRDHKFRSILQPCNFQYHWCPKGCDSNRWHSVTFAQSFQRQSECWHVAFNKIKIRNNLTSQKKTQWSLLAQNVLVLLWLGHSRTFSSFRPVATVCRYSHLLHFVETRKGTWEKASNTGRTRKTHAEHPMCTEGWVDSTFCCEFIGFSLSKH